MDSGMWAIVVLVFVGGLVVGSCIGVTAMALMVASGRSDEAEWEGR